MSMWKGAMTDRQTLYCSKETWMRTWPETGSFPMGWSLEKIRDG